MNGVQQARPAWLGFNCGMNWQRRRLILALVLAAGQAWEAGAPHAAADALRQGGGQGGRRCGLRSQVGPARCQQQHGAGASERAVATSRAGPTGQPLMPVHAHEAPCLRNVQALLLSLFVHTQPASLQRGGQGMAGQGMGRGLQRTRAWARPWQLMPAAPASEVRQPPILAGGPCSGAPAAVLRRPPAATPTPPAPFALTLRNEPKRRREREQVQAAMHSVPSSCMPSWRPEPP